MNRHSPLSDPDRLEALRATRLLDTPPEEAFDRLTRLVSRVLDAPVSLVSLVDDQRQFFKSAQGLPEPWNTCRETPLSHSFCKHVVSSGTPLQIDDAPGHALVCNNAAVIELDVKAYLGVPLITPKGLVIGSLCAIDDKPRAWTAEDRQALTDLANVVMREVGHRHEIEERQRSEHRQEVLIRELHHRMKNTLAVIHALISLSLRTATSLESFSTSISGRIASLAATHSLLIDRQWISVSLRDLLENEIRPYAGDQRVVAEGPSVHLPSSVAVAIGMSVHELITNSVKYGALSVAGGRVSLKWTADERDGGTAITLDWRESGGPAVVEPKRRGFGSLLFDRVLLPQLNGRIHREFHPDGLHARIESMAYPEP